MDIELLSQVRSYITLQSAYVLCSAIVAVVIYIEGEILKTTHGKLPESKFFHISSLIDTVWFFVSMAVVYIVDLTSLALAVPAAYGIYTISGWVYGSRLLKNNGIPENPRDLVIPMRYVAFSQSFSLIFFSLCLLVLSSPWLLPTPTA